LKVGERFFKLIEHNQTLLSNMGESLDNRFLLYLYYIFDPLLGKGKHLLQSPVAKVALFGSGLHLDKTSTLRTHDIHIHVCAAVLFVTQVEEDCPIHDADAHSSQMLLP
jgi:hypothetical protein